MDRRSCRDCGKGIKSLSGLSRHRIRCPVLFVAQYADIGPEQAPIRFGTASGWHPILEGRIGGLRQLGAKLRYDPSGLALV